MTNSPIKQSEFIVTDPRSWQLITVKPLYSLDTAVVRDGRVNGSEALQVTLPTLYTEEATSYLDGQLIDKSLDRRQAPTTARYSLSHCLTTSSEKVSFVLFLY